MFTGGRKMRVNVSPNVELTELRPGQEVVLNEMLNVVIAQGYETAGEVVMLKEVLADSKRALVISQADEERVVRLAEPLLHQPLRAGDSLLLESRSGYVYERIPKAEVEELILEEVPDPVLPFEATPDRQPWRTAWRYMCSRCCLCCLSAR